MTHFLLHLVEMNCEIKVVITYEVY